MLKEPENLVFFEGPVSNSKIVHCATSSRGDNCCVLMWQKRPKGNRGLGSSLQHGLNIYLFIYLKGRATERIGEPGRGEGLPSVGSLTKWPQ